MHREAKRLSERRTSLLSALVAVSAAIVLSVTGVLDDLERSTVDARFAVRGAVEPREDVVLVGIDDVTFSDLRLRWPFPRDVHAEVLDRITADRPRAIVYDVQFSEESDPTCDTEVELSLPRCVTAVEADNALILALRRSGRVALATTEVAADGRPNVLGGDPDALAFARARAGNARFVIDPGGTFRRSRVRIDRLRTLPIVGAEIALGRAADVEPPQDPFWIAYAGPPGTIPLVSFSRLIARSEDPVPAGTFRDKVVVVGPVAQTLQDVHPTSFSREGEMSGAEIQANALATVLDGFPLRSLPRVVEALLAALLAVVPVATLRRRRTAVASALVALGGSLAITVVLTAAAVALFSSGVIVPVVVPLVALALGTVLALAVGLVREAVEREYTRRMFGRFVSDDVVDQVLAMADGGDGVRLGGERMETTILLSDIRGFTTFSEQHRPEVVLEILNRYLSTMSEAILDRGGTITGFLGDGIIAVFGAPIAHPDHADRAVEAAHDMLARCERFNRELAAEGRDVAFRMGVGLNSGPVMVGNVGSERRLEYTVIGDVVNTAARLEGATKGTPYDLFVAEATYRRLTRDHPELTFHDTIGVRGRAAGIGVYVVEPSEPAPARTTIT
jgi:adenylate cyclase